MQTLIQAAFALHAYLTKYQRVGPIDYHWVGNLTDHSATIKLVPYANHQMDHIKITVNSIEYVVPYINHTYTLHIYDLSLTTNTVSYLDQKFEFKTPGPKFSFAAISCQHTLSSSEVFKYVKDNKPDFTLMLGDLFYGGHRYLTTDQFEYAVHEVFKSKEMREFYTTVPIRYMLDDHDVGINNANGNHMSTHFAIKGYNKVVPGALQTVFEVQGVKFIQTDSRSQLMTNQGTNVFGPEQLQWILDEVSASAAINQNVIILLSFSWKSGREFSENQIHEKVAIARRIMQLGFNTLDKPWLVMISGDSHMMTYDDGTQNLYGGFPIFQCSPIDSTPACKWPGWSDAVELGRGQYCHFSVETNAEGAQVLNYKGYRMNEIIQSHQVSRSNPPPRLPLSEGSNIWDWHTFDDTTTVESNNKKLVQFGYNCPYMKPKEWARIPLAVWALMIWFLVLYTSGRMITVFGKRICE